MNRNWHRHAAGGLPILSAALLSAVGLLWNGAQSSAAAQANSGSSGDVIVNYDVLNALPGQHGQSGAHVAPGLAPAPTGMPTSGLTAVGRDGRPTTPIKLKKPGSEDPAAVARPQVVAVTPPDEPAVVPTHVPMPAPTPPAPAPGVNADLPISPVAPTTTAEGAPTPVVGAPAAEAPAPVVEAPAPVEHVPVPAVAAAVPEPEVPAPAQPAEAVREQVAQQPADEAPSEEEGTAAAEPEEQPAEQAAAEPAQEPDNSQPAPPIPQGGIRIIYPTDMNDVPVEANAALDDLAAQMLADDEMRIQIKCYASGNEETESKARRRALQRCLNIRQYLYKNDVNTTRMDVRALGLKSEGQPADRVDIVPANS